MRRLTLALAGLVLIVAACGDDADTGAPAGTGDTVAPTSTTAAPEETTTTTTPEETISPEPSATFTGPFATQPGLTGTVTFEISASGGQVGTLAADILADGYHCNGATVSGGFVTTIEPEQPIPIREGAFDLDWDTVKWHGTFVSATTAQGTFWINNQGCEYGPVTWEATSN